MNLINRTQCKKLIKQLSIEHRQGKFTRVSDGFLNRIEFEVKRIIYNSVKEHPTIGKTITEFKRGNLWT